MRHKKYNKLIDIKKRSYTKDELGDKQRSSLSLVKKAWAQIKPMSGNKVVQYDQVEREKMVEIRIHYPRNYEISKDYVIMHANTEYQITSFYPDEQHKEMIIEAKRYE